MKSIVIALGLMAARAAAKVQAGGASALDDEHASRKADIEFYTTGFDGGDAKLTCVRPIIPPTSAGHQAWRDSTVLFATTRNEETKQKMAAKILEFELSMQRQREFMGNNSSGRTMDPGRVISK